MEDILNKLSNSTPDAKRFILDVDREVGIESLPKQKFIKELLGSKLTLEELFLGQ